MASHKKGKTHNPQADRKESHPRWDYDVIYSSVTKSKEDFAAWFTRYCVDNQRCRTHWFAHEAEGCEECRVTAVARALIHGSENV